MSSHRLKYRERYSFLFLRIYIRARCTADVSHGSDVPGQTHSTPYKTHLGVLVVVNAGAEVHCLSPARVVRCAEEMHQDMVLIHYKTAPTRM